MKNTLRNSQQNKEENLDKKVSFKEKSFVKSLIDQNYAKLSKSKDKFVDELFPPSQSSINPGKAKKQEESKQPEIPSFIKKQLPPTTTKMANIGETVYVWKRLSELYKQNEINIVKEPAEIKDFPDIMTEDVVQGDLGDCYFLSVLSALAEKPGRLKTFFPNPNFSSSGVFECKVYIHGEPVSICVDDFFPCKEVGEGVFELAFTGINKKTKNIWPMLLEKVWAKVNLNYDNIVSGVPSEAFEFLSPAPFDTLIHEHSHDIIYDQIKSADGKNYIICCSITQSDTSVDLGYLSKMGLISNHAYTIIAAYEISELSGKRVRLLKLRNPWGSNEWSGDWSDNSSKWNPELKKLLNFKDENDGTFYICYEDYLRFYTTTYISKFHDDYFFVSSKFDFDPKEDQNLVTVKVTSEGHGFFILNQKNKRIYKNIKNNPDFDNRFCSIVVFKKDKSFSYVGAMSGKGNRLYVEANLTPGLYVVAVFFPTKQEEGIDDPQLDYSKYKSKYSEIMKEESISYRIGVYSNINKLQVVKVPEKEVKEYESSLKQVMMNRAEKLHSKHYFIEEGEKDAWRSIAFEDDNGFICYNNPSEAYIYERITFTSLYGLNIVPIFDGHEARALDVDDEEEFEDPYERHAVGKLKNSLEGSKISIVKAKDKNSEVSEENPLIIDVKIAPKTQGILLLEKYDINSGMEIDSNITLVYPLHVILSEKKFKVKKSRVKYGEKFAEIYETVIEHNCGILFKYRKITKDLKFTIHIKFSSMNNLELKRNNELLEGIELEGASSLLKKKTTTYISVDDYKSVDPTELNIEVEDEHKEIVMSLEPGETKFFELSSLEIFEVFSYECETHYHINLSRKQAKINFGF